MNSYQRIFKSTALIGGTQVIRMAIGVVQVKALALLLGPGGMGLAGLYQSAIGVIGTISGFGIDSAGIRQIAEAASSGDQDRISRTVQTLRRTAFVFGLAGMAGAMAFCVPLSRVTFGNTDYAWGIAIVSLTLLFGGVSAGQTALLQGVRRLKDLAKCGILGSAFGAVASIALVWFLREQGIPLYIAAGSAFGILASWWFARKVPVKKTEIPLRDMVSEARALLGLGMAFMTTGLMIAGTAYLIRVLILRRLGMEAVGLYTATVTVSSLYVGMVFGAMGTDFYPRLTGVARDHAALNRLVNEQTEMGILIALPGILFTFTLAPWLLRIFYSEAFVAATDIIRWQILGIALRVVGWPLSYIQLAKGMSRLYMTTEAISNLLHVALVLVGIHFWGLEGIGIAFFAMYVCYVMGIYVVCRRLTGFSWSRRAFRLLVPASAAIALLLAAAEFLPETGVIAAGLILTLVVGFLSFHFIQRLLNVSIWRFFAACFTGSNSLDSQRHS